VVLAIRPPLARFNVPAATVTWPAFPVLAGRLPKGPSALLTIPPPLMIESVPTLTVTSPASPLLPARESAAMPVLATPIPSIVSWPSTMTDMLPPFPCPNVLLSIPPLLAIDNVPAYTVIWPAFPVLAGRLSNAPSVLLKISPPLTIDRAPAVMVRLPAFPMLPGLADTEIPVRKSRSADVASIVN
jgi:hypothetical protein